MVERNWKILRYPSINVKTSTCQNNSLKYLTLLWPWLWPNDLENLIISSKLVIEYTYVILSKPINPFRSNKLLHVTLVWPWPWNWRITVNYVLNCSFFSIITVQWHDLWSHDFGHSSIPAVSNLYFKIVHHTQISLLLNIATKRLDASFLLWHPV